MTVWLGGVLLVRAAEVCSGASGNRKDVHDGTGSSLHDLELSVLAKRTMGEQGDKIADACIIVMNFGGVCSYVVLVGGLTTSVLAEWYGAFDGTGFRPAWDTFFIVTPLMVFLFVLPPCLVRHLSNLRWVASWPQGEGCVTKCVLALPSPIISAT